MEPCGVAPQGGEHEAEVDVLSVCMLTWSKAVLLPAPPGGPLEDWRLPTPLSVVYHSPVSITDPSPAPAVGGRGRKRERN